jgi:hypothetical protein
MKRFADYFEHAFTDVTAYHFPWVKLFRKKPLSKTVDVSLKFIVLLFFPVDFYIVMTNHEIEILTVVM